MAPDWSGAVSWCERGGSGVLGIGSVGEGGLFDYVLRCCKDELGRMGEIGPFVGENFFNKEFLLEIFEWLGWKGFDVEATDFLR